MGINPSSSPAYSRGMGLGIDGVVGRGVVLIPFVFRDRGVSIVVRSVEGGGWAGIGLHYGTVESRDLRVPYLTWVLVDSFVSVRCGCGAIAKSNVMRRGVILGQKRTQSLGRPVALL